MVSISAIICVGWDSLVGPFHGTPAYFTQFFHNLLSESAIFDSIKRRPRTHGPYPEYFPFSNLNHSDQDMSHTYGHVHGYLERASGSCTCLLENQCNIFSNQTVAMIPLMFLLFQLCGSVHKIRNLLRCKNPSFLLITSAQCHCSSSPVYVENIFTPFAGIFTTMVWRKLTDEKRSSAFH